MNKPALLFVAAVLPCVMPTATAQCTGQFAPGSLCGNPSTTAAPPRALTSTNSYWTSESTPSIVARLNDRVFVGKNTNLYSGDSTDSMETWVSTVVTGIFSYLERNGQVLNYSTFGEPAQLNAVRSSDNLLLPVFPNQTCCAIAMATFAYNDNTTHRQTAWPYYSTGLRLPGTGNIVSELDVLNADTTTQDVNPYRSVGAVEVAGGGAAVGYAFQCGGEAAGLTASMSPCSAGLYIGGNGSTFNKGIVIQALGITGPSPIGISMGNTMLMEWQYASAQRGAFITSNNASTATTNGLIFSASGALFTGDVNAVNLLAQIEFVASAVNRPVLTASPAGTPIKFSALGSDTNITILLQPQGAGIVASTTALKTGTVAVGSLPTCNAAARGTHYFVTDSNAASFTAGIGAIVAAGGATNVPVVCDGTNWRIG